jgi:hypothetical protein
MIELASLTLKIMLAIGVWIIGSLAIGVLVGGIALILGRLADKQLMDGESAVFIAFIVAVSAAVASAFVASVGAS